MDPIKKAVERAKADQQLAQTATPERARRVQPAPSKPARLTEHAISIPFSTLERHRIIAHNMTNPSALGFDLLRTKIIQHMKLNGWKTLMVTSPTPGCGKTVTTINLAFSLARLSEQHIAVLDLDLRKPQVANYLELPPGRDLKSVLNGDAKLMEALVAVSAMGPEFLLLPTFKSFDQPAETLTSPAMQSLMESVTNLSDQMIVLLDTSPILYADDVIALIPQVDAVLLVVASGQSTTQEVESCRKLIPKDKFAGIVFAKAMENSGSNFYGYDSN